MAKPKKSLVESRSLGLHKNLDSIRYSRLLFLFELEKFTACDATAASNLSLRQWRNGSSSFSKPLQLLASS
jgi:hypothetical protein